MQKFVPTTPPILDATPQLRAPNTALYNDLFYLKSLAIALLHLNYLKLNVH
jgi:hypothetical protein